MFPVPEKDALSIMFEFLHDMYKALLIEGEELWYLHEGNYIQCQDMTKSRFLRVVTDLLTVANDTGAWSKVELETTLDLWRRCSAYNEVGSKVRISHEPMTVWNLIDHYLEYVNSRLAREKL